MFLKTMHPDGENQKSLLFRDFCPGAPGPDPEDLKDLRENQISH
jgi:hypothetical protein